MNEFIVNHILGIIISQMVIGIGALVKLYFDFNTLKRDFVKKEKEDEKTHNKDEQLIKDDLQKLEAKIDNNYEKIETKIENNANQIEKFREEYRTDQQTIRDTLTKLNLYHEILQDNMKKLEIASARIKKDMN
ncbi:hypothetical protein [Chondrinema litorale]|uniref:hypothetical protein n=1 Tax=Chondrinema litorale TaxID=2994555 RepID=UPI000C5C436E|nr:hypothetical protein [Chondrinema litorale]MBT29837.1 hypothetical protein [Thalassovita sp.]UZR95334.1 hypothetical protein OQ292_05805 [Chondrinema litorale]